METDDTICAISTPPGEGGIGIIRISGPRALTLLNKTFRPRKNQKGYQSHQLHLGLIVDPESRETIDEVYAVFMRAPHTYTREDVAEIQSHGGIAAQRSILSLLIRKGARHAEPGEFTKRAFLNGRIDLPQAESVLDIIQSETADELKSALSSLQGALSQRINEHRENIRNVLVDVEAQIDFPDEEIDVDPMAMLPVLLRTKGDIEGLVESYYEGKAVRYGLDVMIVGRTNVGKSSLLNALLLSDRAIVTPLPGTTRDLIEETLHIKGIKVRITDTAGLRKPKNVVEREGIEKVRQKIPGVDLILWVLDGSQGYSEEDRSIRETIKEARTIAVINKIDLPQALKREELSMEDLPWVEVSALRGTGMETLRNAVYNTLMGQTRKMDKVLITNLRHRDALVRTRDAIQRAIACGQKDEPLEFLALELREALHHLGEITGETCPEDILRGIFERFCIGK
jgi:tRNA modification GTPase